MYSRRAVRSAARSIPLCLTALLAAFAGQAAAAGAPAEVTAPIPGEMATFRLANPDAASSDAQRVFKISDAIGRPTGYTVTSRVIVKSPDAGLVKRSLAAEARRSGTPSVAGFAVRQMTVPGHFIIEAGTAAEAARLASKLHASGAFASVELDVVRPVSLRALPTDPLFPNQWHLRNTSVTLADVNAEAAWDMGYTGAGVTIGIVEGGFQTSHPDLSGNYVSAASQSGGVSSHATACAGIAAAVGGNGTGVVGLAYNAGISQQIYGSSSQTANAFVFRNDIVDVKSNSWGPFDSGEYWYASSSELTALENAALNGRGGLGTVICWAAGNGGSGDRVEYDPYASSRYVLAIGSVGDQDRRAYYNERGSSMLVVTHSSGNNRGTSTTNSGSSYTSSFGGTSSASPLGAGAVALALEANPALTWRDVMHLLIETARMVDPSDADWSVNAAGYDISYDYGFGAIDAGELVAAAETWTNVGPEVSDSSGLYSVDDSIPDNNSTGVSYTVPIEADIIIESVELVVNISHTRRGDLEIILTSPDGTPSILAVSRTSDNGNHLNDYVLTSHRPFGESSQGDWTVKVADRRSSTSGTLEDFEIRVYGTAAVTACSEADINADGTLNNTDINLFVSAFLENDASADLNGDGMYNNTDINLFVQLFLAGC